MCYQVPQWGTTEPIPINEIPVALSILSSAGRTAHYYIDHSYGVLTVMMVNNNSGSNDLLRAKLALRFGRHMAAPFISKLTVTPCLPLARGTCAELICAVSTLRPRLRGGKWPDVSLFTNRVSVLITAGDGGNL